MMDVPGDSSSSDLLRRAQAGDQQALNALIQRYIPRLRVWARGRVPRAARGFTDTQDVVQETIIAALRNLPRIEVTGEAAVPAYLRTALGTCLIDRYRQALRRPAGEELGSDLVDQRPSPLEEAIGAEALARYEAALARLADDDRQAIILRIELQYGYKEIAAALTKSSEGAARVAVSRALTRLAREMRHARP
jgi:RNA polymerase sigma-70 factor (ECF subfamily)